MNDLSLYGGTDDAGKEWAYVCLDDDDDTTVAQFFGEGAGVNAQIFMENRAVIDAAKQFVADYLAALNEAKISPNGDDFNALCDGLLDVLAFNPSPTIEISEGNR